MSEEVGPQSPVPPRMTRCTFSHKCPFQMWRVWSSCSLKGSLGSGREPGQGCSWCSWAALRNQQLLSGISSSSHPWESGHQVAGPWGPPGQAEDMLESPPGARTLGVAGSDGERERDRVGDGPGKNKRSTQDAIVQSRMQCVCVCGGMGHVMREVRPLPGPCRPHPGQPGPPRQWLSCGLEAAARVKEPRWVAPLGRNHS